MKNGPGISNIIGLLIAAFLIINLLAGDGFSLDQVGDFGGAVDAWDGFSVEACVADSIADGIDKALGGC